MGEAVLDILKIPMVVFSDQAEIGAETGLPLRGFGDMTAREIAARSGLSLGDAILAAERGYDEPFVGIEDDSLLLVVQAAERRGLQVVIGLGDSANDEPMLRAVDTPVLVRRPDGGHLEVRDLPGVVIAPYAGREGWREVVLSLLRRAA